MHITMAEVAGFISTVLDQAIAGAGKGSSPKEMRCQAHDPGVTQNMRGTVIPTGDGEQTWDGECSALCLFDSGYFYLPSP